LTVTKKKKKDNNNKKGGVRKGEKKEEEKKAREWQSRSGSIEKTMITLTEKDKELCKEITIITSPQKKERTRRG